LNSPRQNAENPQEKAEQGKDTGKSVDEREPIQIRQFIDKINEWRGGGILGQADANRIRVWINTHILNSINWEAELLRPFKPDQSNIYLPRARGNPPDPEKAFVLVATDETFSDPKVANEVFSGIRGMLRYDHYNGWDYGQGDEDYIAVSNFLNAYVENATRWIRGRYKNIEGCPIASLVPALIFQARLLNVESAHKSDDANQIDSIFSQPSELNQPNDDPDWTNFLGDMRTNRKLLQEDLLERVAAYQGTGKAPHAVDASQLLEPVQNIRKTWKVTERYPSIPSSSSFELKAIERHINWLVRTSDSRIENRRNRIVEQSELIVSKLGTEYNKTELIKDLTDVCTLSEQHGLKGEVTVSEIRKLVEKFKETRAKEVSDQVDAINFCADRGAQLTAIAKLDIDTLALLVEFVKTCSRFLKERANKAHGQILAWTPEVVETKKANVAEILKELEVAVTPYQKDDA